MILSGGRLMTPYYEPARVGVFFWEIVPFIAQSVLKQVRVNFETTRVWFIVTALP